MDTLKNIFDNAAKQTVDSTSGWFEIPTFEFPSVEKIKKAIKKTAEEIKPAEVAENYMKAVQYFQAQRAKLPGRVETGGMMSFKAPGQISSMPGATRGLRAESFTDKIAEVRGRMRAFATDKYYSDITYGK